MLMRVSSSQMDTEQDHIDHVKSNMNDFERKNKNLYPVTIPGRATIGLCELMYEFKSQFKFRAVFPDRSKSSKPLLSFFIRLTNWKKISNPFFIKNTPNDKFKEIENKVLINYIEKVYFPIKKHQMDLIEADIARKRLK